MLILSSPCTRQRGSARYRHARTGRIGGGFTLIELMVVVAIVGILTAAAVPMFTTYVSRQEINAEISALSSSLRLARSEALKRGLPVTICPTGNPDAAAPSCMSSADATMGWATGWLVFSDVDTRGVVEGNDTVIARQAAFSGSGGIIPSKSAYTITYFPNGLSTASAVSFTFQAKGDPSNAKLQKAICINMQGSTRLC